MKRFAFLLLLLPLAVPAKAEALTWKEFWEPFADSYHHGHSHGSPHWQDWRYDHHHHRPRYRRCERVVDYEKWIPGHWGRLSNGDEYYVDGYVKSWSEIRWYRC
mgnify:FL=1|tara:strand:+ start:181 stop:492 length:312 start_codon:yes stop_codon:yes gene_type:complete